MLQRQAAKRQTSIKIRIALTTLVTVSIVLVSVSSALFFYFHTLLRESIFRQQFVMVTEIAEQLNGRIQLARHQLSLAATEIDSRVLANPHELERALSGFSPINMIFDAGFVVIGTDGRVIAENMGYAKLVGMDLNHREYVRESLRTGKPYLSGPFRFTLPPHNPLIAMVTPVRDNNDTVICLLAGYHSLGSDQFLTTMNPKGFGSTGYLSILHGRTILMHPDNGRIMETIPEGMNRGIDQAVKGMEGSLDNVNSKGLRVLSSYKMVGETSWILNANTPYNDAFSPLNKLAVNAVLIAALGIMFSLLVLWFVTRRLTLPIGQLSAHIDSIDNEKSEWQPIELHTGDEIERLADAFNSLMHEVSDTRQLLRDEKDFISSIIENAAAPIFVIDHNHKIIFWNTALTKLTGKSSFQMLGTRLQWTPFYPKNRPVLADLVIDRAADSIDNLYTNHSSALLLEGSLKAEGWYDNLGGKRRYIFFEAAPIKNSNNEIIAAIETLEDITDRKLAEEAAATYSIFLREIMAAMPDPVYYKNSEGVYLGCNAAFNAFFCKTEEEIIGRTVLDIMPERYSEQNIQQDRNVIESCRSVRYETELMRGDGMIRSALVSKAPFSNSDGSIAGIVGTFVDITDQRRMDDQVRKMSRALEQSPATIVITNLDGIIEYVNPKFCQTTGYTPEEAIGQNPNILKSGGMSSENYSELWKTISSGQEWRGEFHNKRKDGTLYWELASISPLFDKNGAITGYLAVKEDITERKEVEAELAKSRMALEANHSKLEHLFTEVEHGKREWEETLDHLRDFIILTDPEHRIRRYNKLLADATGRPINGLIGLDWRDLITDAGFHFITFNGSNGEIFHQKSGRSYDISVYSIEDCGQVNGFVVSINDTTELHTATQELQRAYLELKEAQLQIFQQEKLASIGQLAAGVAHEINNPMGYISSNLTTLDKYMDRLTEYVAAGERAIESCSSDESEKLKNIRNSLKIDYILDDSRLLITESQDGARRVRYIVKELMNFSRVDQAECALVNLNETLETAINIAGNEIRFIASINREFGDIPEIVCFSQQLNQVFLNLLVNAGHAMEVKQDGILTIRTWSEGDYVYVSITDTGYGIPEDIRQRIFEPFFTTKEVGKGTGLGLSISYDIIKKHGGEIRVESEVGKGTTFIVRLPIAGPPQEPAD